MKEWFPPRLLYGLVAALLAAFMLNIPFAVYPQLVDKGPSWLGLDVSWQMTLNYALSRHWTWGRDIICTYGPLGFLATRIGSGISRWIFLLFDLFLSLNFFFLFRDFLRQANDKFLAILILLGIALLAPPYFGTDLSWVILILTYYWLYKSYHTPRFQFFAMACILAVLCFYIKLNSGLLGISFIVIHLANLYIAKKITLRRGIGIFCSLLVLLLVTASFLHVSLYSYTLSALELIKGYNAIMYLTEEHDRIEYITSLLFYGLLLLCAIYGYLLIMQKRYHEIFFACISIIYILLMRKQSMLRNDVQHLYEFSAFAPFVLLYGNLLSFKTRFQKILLGSSLIIVNAALFLFAEGGGHEGRFSERIHTPITYWAQFREYTSHQYRDQQGKRYIPARVLEKIKDHTVDIFPWDAEYLIENKLNYTPRPDFQSYSAYTSYLEERNLAFYQEKAPAFVIYDYDAIDGRCPFDEESLVNLYLSQNYTLCDTFTSNERFRLVLQKKPASHPLEFQKLKETALPVTQDIKVGEAALLKLHVRSDWKGKWLAAWGKPSPIQLVVTNSKGETRSYKTSPELLHTGIMVDRFIDNIHDFATYIGPKDSLLKVTHVSLALDTTCFSPLIQVEYFGLK